MPLFQSLKIKKINCDLKNIKNLKNISKQFNYTSIKNNMIEESTIDISARKIEEEPPTQNEDAFAEYLYPKVHGSNSSSIEKVEKLNMVMDDLASTYGKIKNLNF